MGKPRTVLVFGTFDGLHEGHLFFLREAKKRGESLIAVVAHDEVVSALKHHAPQTPLSARMKALEETRLADRVVAGDKAVGTWSIIEELQPDVIATGYDQGKLREHLQAHLTRKILPIEVVTLSPHKPDLLHSSLLNE